MTTEEKISTLERVLAGYIEKYGLSNEARAYFIQTGSNNVVDDTGYFQKPVEH